MFLHYVSTIVHVRAWHLYYLTRNNNEISGVVATGQEDAQIMCNPSDIMEGDTFQWYFTRTTIDNGIQLSDSSKVFGAMSERLTVRNISLSDDGLYYCQTVRNGIATQGACIYAYGKLK